MGRVAFVVLLLLFSNIAYAEDVQKPVVAGYFYPKDKARLEKMVDGFIERAEPEAVEGDIISIIAPHAGYEYSGHVASYAFKLIKDKPYKTAVIIAPSHHYGFEGLAVLNKDSYLTPLGRVAIDKEITKKLLDFDKRIDYYMQPFLKEHAAEVEIPFVQRALKGAKIVVILTGLPSYDTCTLLRDSLTKVLRGRKDVILITSSDMSHYYPETTARRVDSTTLANIRRLDPEALFLKLSDTSSNDRPCGSTGIVGAMMAAKNLGANNIKLLKYATSGDTTGDMSRVVGYSAWVMYKSSTQKLERGMEELLNLSQRRRLLEIARSTIETYVKERKALDFKEEDEALNKEMGAFVTINKHGSLRGCIGNMIGKGPLYLTIRDMAISAATQDPRFPAVTKDELKDIDIEISVLSPLERIDDPNEIIMGKHGVIVQKGFRSGVYLPQVATETGWNKNEFMNSLCAHKAGLPADSWKKGECDILIFTAEVFGEKQE
ncbi:MAG: AmmeMemoRadiSam system protein B [Candidatus Omnitrophica bacterium]|nr:AmmeMemoRadiSam system protein B [Candidatus Omnitrophota bacterium]